MSRVNLSVGINQNFAHCKDRAKFMFWLELRAALDEDARNTMTHINALEGLLDVERYATLSVFADEMRTELRATRHDNLNEYNKGFQAAINLVIAKIEDIDLESQAATSIAELQSAALLDIVTEIRSPDDYQTIVNYAEAIKDGCT